MWWLGLPRLLCCLTSCFTTLMDPCCFLSCFTSFAKFVSQLCHDHNFSCETIQCCECCKYMTKTGNQHMQCDWQDAAQLPIVVVATNHEQRSHSKHGPIREQVLTMKCFISKLSSAWCVTAQRGGAFLAAKMWLVSMQLELLVQCHIKLAWCFRKAQHT